jgi:hypothetical protein
MLEGLTFEPAGRLAQFMRIIGDLDRDTLAAVIERGIDRLDTLDGDPDMEDDDPLDTGNAEDEELVGSAALYSHSGPGCIVADDDHCEVPDDCRPVADRAAAIKHKWRIRRTRCDRIVYRPRWDGRLPSAQWVLQAVQS